MDIDPDKCIYVEKEREIAYKEINDKENQKKGEGEEFPINWETKAKKKKEMFR